jgi:iron(III) transport system permease protein
LTRSALTPERRRGARSRTRKIICGAALVGALLVLCLAPTALVALGSFLTGPLSGHFTTAAWGRLFGDVATYRALRYTFLLAIRLPIALLFALPFSWMLVRLEIPGHRLITYGLWMSFFLPALPIALGWILLLDPDYGLLNSAARELPFVSGPIFNINSAAGIIWVHLTLSTMPIMTILLSSAQRQIDGAYEEAATMSGASLAWTLRQITGPLLVPAILTALIAGLFNSIQVFEVEQLLGVPVGISVFSTQIYYLVTNVPADNPQAMAFSTLMLAILLVIGVLYQFALRRRSAIATMTGRGMRTAPRARTGIAYAASAVIFLALAIGTVLPATVLVASSFTRLFGFFFIPHPWTLAHWSGVLTSAIFLSGLRNSALLGLVLGTLGTAACSCLAWLFARSSLPGLRLASLLVWLPWGVPGILLGLSFLHIFLTVPVLSALYGTIAPLIIVLLVANLPFGTYMLRSSIGQISRDLEEAAYMSGATDAIVLRRIILPLILPMMLSIFVIIFMSALRDISMTVLLATPGTRTLPLVMFEFASEGNLASASVVGVIMALAALVMTFCTSRFGAAMSR